MKIQFSTPHIITPEVDQQLRMIAAHLPNVKRKNTKKEFVKSMAVDKIRGSVLLEAGIEFEEDNIHRIDPTKFYRMHKPVVVHHYPLICENYRLGGEEAVTKYCESVKKAWYRQQPSSKKFKMFWAALLLIIKPKKKTPVATGAPDKSK